ncbi:MAG: pentapeptide repeat-containing protein [Alphaproteobacteria bacterium]|nr:pentapeptide repeat-containing protein [Alphaproteobacteria bacterium]
MTIKIYNIDGDVIHEADVKKLGEALEDAVSKGVSLKGANLKKAKLRDINLKGADLEGAVFDKAKLQNVCLEDANLKGAKIRRAHLQSVNAKNANFQKADLTTSKIQMSNFNGADFAKADLVLAQIKNSDFTDINLVQAELATYKRDPLYMVTIGASFDKVKVNPDTLKMMERKDLKLKNIIVVEKLTAKEIDAKKIKEAQNAIKNVALKNKQR